MIVNQQIHSHCLFIKFIFMVSLVKVYSHKMLAPNSLDRTIIILIKLTSIYVLIDWIVFINLFFNSIESTITYAMYF